MSDRIPYTPDPDTFDSPELPPLERALEAANLVELALSHARTHLRTLREQLGRLAHERATGDRTGARDYSTDFELDPPPPAE